MKVILINGSPHEENTTYTVLREIADTIEKEGIETEIVNIGSDAMCGCKGCGACRELGKCIVDDSVNTVAEKIKKADGLIIGSPVHYASMAGALSSFLDRLFYSSGAAFAYKPGAAVAVCRRGGATATVDQMTKYFTISQMPVVSSQYWNMAHGNTADEVKKDAEGMQIMRTIGRNMAWLIKCINAGKSAGIEPSFPEQKAKTNFIR